jgi:hypothetical protein
MGCDAMVALGRATVDGQTLFGQTCYQPRNSWQPLCCTAGRAFTGCETVRTQHLDLPQARQTYKVVGSQPEGCWGYDHGLNEHQVAAGWAALRPALPGCKTGLLGTDLVRLALERSRSARQAVQTLTELIERHGQAGDHALLLADPAEAYAVETAGRYWVCQEVREIRVQTNVRVVRQDWDRICPGLASHAIDRGWWPADGSKIDFAGALRENAHDEAGVLAHWGRATLVLHEQNGHIDSLFLRRVLLDQDENDSTTPSAGFLCRLSTDPTALPLAWSALGPPGLSIYLPAFLDGDIPAGLSAGNALDSHSRLCGTTTRLGEQLRRNRTGRSKARDIFARLQARFDQETDEFAAEGMALKKQGALNELHRQATYFMQYNLERLETALADLLPERLEAAVSFAEY